MLLQPKRTRYIKSRKGKLPKFNFKPNHLQFGNMGIKSTESGILTARQIESARQAVNRKIKRKGKVWVRIFPSCPITTKPTEVRMGKGKGNVSYWSVKIAAGTTLFEVCSKNNHISSLALMSGGKKLPLKTKLIYF